MQLAFKIDFTIAISVKYVNNALYKRVLMQLWQRHEFLNTERARLIKIQLAESLAKSLDLFRINCKICSTLLTYCLCLSYRQCIVVICPCNQ